MTSSSVRRVVETLLIAAFLAAICLPLAGKLLPTEGSFALTENRRPAPFPTLRLSGSGWGWTVASFPRRFERYWNDSFAFRWYLIRAHSLAKLALGASPSPKVLLGQEGFLFYAAEQSVDYFRVTKPFTDADLARWRDDLMRRHQWLAERGIRYLVVVAPNKETIYPEHMPPSLRPLREESRLDQLLREVGAKSDVEILDLRPALREGKARERIYHVTDTHWNDAGAMIARREILGRVARWFPQVDTSLPDGSFVRRTGAGGDLARMLALEDRFAEEYIEWRPAGSARAQRIEPLKGASGDHESYECPACSGPVVVMNQDSFNENLAPLLAGQFRRLVLVDGTRIDESLIARERPALVIQEFVERALMCRDLRC
jgi:hypothetical protein